MRTKFTLQRELDLINEKCENDPAYFVENIEAIEKRINEIKSELEKIENEE